MLFHGRGADPGRLRLSRKILYRGINPGDQMPGITPDIRPGSDTEASGLLSGTE